MRILLFGNAYMTSLAERALAGFHTVVGHVPNKRCNFPGEMQSRPIAAELAHMAKYDIAISVLYDRRIEQGCRPIYNIHPATLPDFGGVNTSFWALRMGAKEFGWTCHEIVHDFDAGPILSKVTFPIVKGDTEATLYKRQASILPCFVRTCVKLIEELKGAELPPQSKFNSGYYTALAFARLDPAEKVRYRQSGAEIAAYVKEKTA